MYIKPVVRRRFTAFLCVFFSFMFLFSVPVEAVTPPDNLTSKSCLIYNLETDKILYGSHIDDKVFPTSTVKIIAGLLALEYYENRMDEVLEVTAESMSGVGGTTINLVIGEELTARDLIYAVLVPGANDAVCVLGYHIAGNVTAFVNMMNQKVRELGCENTYFTNCTGVHDENMVTTARDMLRIALYAYSNSNFMAMSSETSYVIEPTNKRPTARTITNRNYIVSTNYFTKYYNSLAKGMNAGNTREGGYCLVTSIRKKGCTYIIVCMGSYYDEEENFVYSYRDCGTLVNWAYDNYDFVSVVDTTTMICEIPVTLSSSVDYVTLLPSEPIEMFLPKDIDIDTAVQLHYILLSDTIEAPVKEGQIAGILTVRYDDELYDSVNLVTKGSISRSEFLFILTTIKRVVKSPLFFLCVIIGLVIALFYVLFKAVYLEKARRRALRRKRPDLTRRH
ncbi:MAG: hypothetical protein MJ175_07580 [Clostridia bacterium]|nr:hypothetical protein [Clostridia bacterium]